MDKKRGGFRNEKGPMLTVDRWFRKKREALPAPSPGTAGSSKTVSWWNWGSSAAPAAASVGAGVGAPEGAGVARQGIVTLRRTGPLPLADHSSARGAAAPLYPIMPYESRKSLNSPKKREPVRSRPNCSCT